MAAFQADAEVNWIRRHEPEVWARTAGYLFVSGFLTRRLVGRAVDSVGSQVGYVPFDYKRLRWSAPGDWKWQVAPIDPAMLPELIPPGGRLGQITAAAAEATGIPVGLPLIAAAADKACEVLGAGVIEPWIGALSYGTTATLNTTQRRYVEAIPMIPPYPAAARRVQPGDPGHARLLDGRVVQARVRRPRGGPGGGRGGRARGPLRRAHRLGSARLDGPDPPAVLVTRASGSRDRRRRARSSAGATSTPGPTSTGRSSRAWPTPCAKAPSGPSSGRRRS